MVRIFAGLISNGNTGQADAMSLTLSPECLILQLVLQEPYRCLISTWVQLRADPVHRYLTVIPD